MKKTIYIDGMMCAHCQARVKKAYEAAAGVVCAEVDLKEKKAVVTLSEPLSDQALMDIAAKAGSGSTLRLVCALPFRRS